jgi:hypothetical protein
MAQTKKVQEERKAQLIAMGFELFENGKIYSHESGVSIDVIPLRDSSKEHWDTIIGEVKNVIEIAKPIPVTHSEEVPHTEKGIEISKRNAESDIAKFDFNKAKITEAGKVYSVLAIASLTDKENYKKVREAKSVMRTARTTLEKRRKELKDWYLVEGKKIDDYAKECFGMIEPIESHLDAELEKFEAWQKEEDERKEREANAECDRRVNVLKDAGMVFNGNYYAVGESMSMDISTIRNMPLPEFDNLVEKVKLEKVRLEVAAETERKRKEQEEQEARRQREEYEAGQRKLKEEQDRMEREKRQLEEEKENMRKQKISMRETMCKNIGMQFDSSLPAYVFENQFCKAIVSKETIETLNDTEFAAKIDECNTSIQEGKKAEEAHRERQRQQREKDEADRLERQRIANETYMQRSTELISLGMVLAGDLFVRKNEFNDKAFITVEVVKATSDDLWPSALDSLAEKVKEVNDLTDSKRKAIADEKEALKPEVQRAWEYFQKVNAIAVPDFENEQIKKVVTNFAEIVAKTATEAYKIIEELQK